MPLPLSTPISGVFWHQCAPRYEGLSFCNPATAHGRYSRKTYPGAWYAASQEQAAWAEFLKHFSDRISPTEVKRRMVRVRVSALPVLDLTSATTRDQVGLTVAALTGDDTTPCQRIARQAAQAGFGGILAPSAGLPGRRTLAVFSGGMPHVTLERDVISRLPSRVLDLADMIPMPALVRENFERWLGETVRTRNRLRALRP